MLFLFMFLFDPPKTVNALITGAIEGTVTTIEGVPLQNVTVTVRGSVNMGPPRSTLSGKDGDYRFLGLAPGSYELRATHHDGATGFEPVHVFADRVFTHNITLLLSGGMSRIVVIAHDDTTAALPRVSVLNAEQIDHLPLPNNRYQDTLPLTPEITRSNDGDFHSIGSRNRQIAFLIDGENTTDPVTGTFGFNIPVDAISSLEVIPFGYSAEYGHAQGGIVNIVTASGSEVWTGSLYSFTPVLDYDGVKVMGISSWNPGFFLSGPLFNDRLRLTFTSEYRYGETRIEELNPGENRQYRRGFDLFLGLNFHKNSRHQTKLTVLTFPLRIENRYLAFNRPRETTVDYLQNGYAVSLIDTFIFSDNTTLESRLKYHQIRLASVPKGDNAFQVFPDSYRGNYYNEQDRSSQRYGYAAVLTHHHEFLGKHQFRVGTQLEQTDYIQHYHNNDIEYYNARGQLYRRLSYVGEPTFRLHRFSVSLFMQDNWQLNEYLTIYAGLRFDADQLFQNKNGAPRLGLMLTPFKSKKTTIRAGWGRFYDQIPLVAGAYEDFPVQYETLYDEDTGEISQGPNPTLALLDSSLKTPYGDQWFVQWEQQWLPSFSTHLRYLEKRGFDELQDISIITEKEQKNINQKLLLTNANHSTFKSISVGTDFDILRKYAITFDYVWSASYGDGYDWNTLEGDTPEAESTTDEWAPLPWDTPHRFLLRSSAPLFWGFSLTCLAEYRTGYPYSIVNEDQEIVGDKNGHRFPDYFRFDALLNRRFHLTTKIDVVAQGGAINLTNHFNPEYVQNNCDATDFGSFYGSNDISLQLQIRFVPSEKHKP